MRRLALTCLFSVLALAVQAQETLTILHTNDFHARFEPITARDATCAPEDNTAGSCFGGSARLATAIEQARTRLPNTLLLDGGDQFQGTLFYTHYKGKLTAEMMNRLGYDAMTVGNHEFDDGPEVLRGFMEAVDFPVLMSNADVSKDPHLAGQVLKSTILTRNGIRVGLIGLTPEDTHESSSPGDHITFSDPVAAVQTEVDRLTVQGVTKIIVLSHSGYHIDLHVARETTGVDVIVGGHSNTYLSNDDPTAVGPYPTMVGDTAVVQAYAYGKFLGVLSVTFDAAGRVLSAKGGPMLMDATVAEAPDVKDRIASAALPLEALRQAQVGTLTAPLQGSRTLCRFMECALGNLVAEAMLDRMRDQGADLALTNGGGLRAGLEAGPVTMEDILTVLPFQNTLSTFQLSGTELLEALEHGVSAIGTGSGQFPQIAGARLDIDITAPPGHRLRNVTLGGAPLDPAQNYTVVSNSFLRAGGDGYTMLEKAPEIHDFGADLAEVVATYLANSSPYAGYTDGRLRLTTR